MDSERLFQQAMHFFSQQNTTAAINALRQSAAAGHSMATLYLAEQYFRQSPQDAFTFLKQQWQNGVKGTLHRLVTLKAFFTDDSVNAEDFALLHQEAKAGHVESQLILINLSLELEHGDYFKALLLRASPALFNDLGLSSSGVYENGVNESDLTSLIQGVAHRFNALSKVEPSLVLSKCGILQYRNVVSPLVCEYFRLRLKGFLKPSMVHDPVTGKGIQNSVRTSYIVHVTPEHLDWFSLELDMIIETLTGVSRARGESMNLLRYENGQEYKPHYDAIVGQGEQFDNILRDGGQRIKTAITYLSGDYQGGETAFPKLQLTIKAGIGDILIFDNLDEDGNVLLDSYHAGTPVTEGTKWILTKWIRESATNYGNVVYPKKVNLL